MHRSRLATIFIDIESNDVEREVARFEKLGAAVKARIRNHVVMSAPSGFRSPRDGVGRLRRV